MISIGTLPNNNFLSIWTLPWARCCHYHSLQHCKPIFDNSSAAKRHGNPAQQEVQFNHWYIETLGGRACIVCSTCSHQRYLEAMPEPDAEASQSSLHLVISFLIDQRVLCPKERTNKKRLEVKKVMFWPDWRWRGAWKTQRNHLRRDSRRAPRRVLFSETDCWVNSKLSAAATQPHVWTMPGRWSPPCSAPPLGAALYPWCWQPQQKTSPNSSQDEISIPPR